MTSFEFRHHRLRLVRVAALRGYREGLALPCLHLLCHLDPMPTGEEAPRLPIADEARLVPLRAGCSLSLGRDLARRRDAHTLMASWQPQLEALNAMLVRLQDSAGWPLAGGGVVEAFGQHAEDATGAAPAAGGALAAAAANTAAVIVWPAFEPAVLKRVLPCVFRILGGIAPAESQANDSPATLEVALTLLAAAAPGGTNTRMLLEAACVRGIPLLRLPGRVVQYGWGVHGRWMDSSFTDADSVMSARLARDKRVAHALLARAGLPVPAQRAVGSVDEACAAAANLGYPVVLKPADLDGGKGVEAGLRDEPALRRAYERTRAYSRNLVLERHLEGQDYRLGVLNGRLAWTTWREPAGVWGDGVTSIECLIAVANRDPRRGTQPWAHMTPITIDAEAGELLAEQGLELADVPPAGVFVRLRRAANISSGGRPVDVLEKVHPDNAALAVRAAALFRLSVAGIDLIAPDIERSWRETGAGICEINGQPQFSITRPEVPALAVAELVQGDGRIPVVALLSDVRWGAWSEKLHARLQRAGLETGFVLADGVFIGVERVRDGSGARFDAVQGLLLERKVGAIIFACNGREWLRNGLPVDRLDLAIGDGAEDPGVLRMLWASSMGGCWKSEVLLAKLTGSPQQVPAWVGRLGEFIVGRSTRTTFAASPESTVIAPSGALV